MIVNHKYKFIFIKTRKTAGTSIEVALSRFSNSKDVITPITQEDEWTRQKLGFPGPQNYEVPFEFYNKEDWGKWHKEKQQKMYFNHASAKFIKLNIRSNIWNNYFKFCFERNPFDRAISRYYWIMRNKENKIDFNSFLENTPKHLLSNWGLYAINDKISVDFIGTYENLENDFRYILERLQINESVKLPYLKTKYRLDRKHYSKVLCEKDRLKIEKYCKNEIETFSYHWKEIES